MKPRPPSGEGGRPGQGDRPQSPAQGRRPVQHGDQGKRRQEKPQGGVEKPAADEPARPGTTPCPQGKDKQPGNKEKKKPTCDKEGFFRHPDSCYRFYRCVHLNDTDEYVVYEFNCPEGLVFDERYSTCNWPADAPPCDGAVSDGDSRSPNAKPDDHSASGSDGNTKPGDDEAKPPSGSKQPSQQGGGSGSESADTQDQSQSGTGQGTTPEQSGLPCSKDGFFRNPRDCRKFYRCVEVNSDSGDGDYAVYQFDCPEGLVFDERYSTCNWPDAAPPCVGGQQGKPGSDSDNDGPRDTSTSSSLQETHATEMTETDSTVSSTDTGAPGTDAQTSSTTGTGQASTGTTGTDMQATSTTMQDATGHMGATSTSGTEAGSTATGTPTGSTTDAWTDSSMSTTATDPDITPASTGTGEMTSTGAGMTSTTSADTSATDSGRDDEGTSSPGSSTEPTAGKDCDNATSDTSPSKDPSGRPSSLACTRTGFFRHPKDCGKFYRCVDFHQNGMDYVVYQFDCPEGLVFDERYSTCNWPDQAPPCEGGSPGERKPGRPSSQSSPDKPSGPSSPSGPSGEAGPSGPLGGPARPSGPAGPPVPTEPRRPPGGPSGSSGPSGAPSGAPSRPSGPGQTNLHCAREGFFRHPEDCGRFYRCTDTSGTGALSIYEFDCPKGLAFDERFSVCNWPQNVPGCGDTGSKQPEGERPPGEGAKPADESEDHPSGGTSSQGSVSSPTDEDEQPSGGSSNPSGSEAPGYPEETQTPSRETSGDSTGGSPGGPASQPSDDSAHDPSNDPDDRPEDSPADSPARDGCSPTCTKEGFFRNPANCNKFYRCVDHRGDSDFVMYHFDCPEGTVFDERHSVCNWPHDAPPCDTGTGGGKNQCAQQPGDQIGQPQPEEPPTDGEAPPPSQAGPSAMPPTAQGPMHQRGPKPADASQCTRTGFFRNPSDCNKFYRCVDPYQDGNYVVYEFDCPAGLVFDERYSVCNWPQNAPPCDNRPKPPSKQDQGGSTKPCDKTTPQDTTPSETTPHSTPGQDTTVQESTTEVSTTEQKSTSSAPSTTEQMTESMSTEGPTSTVESRRGKSLDDNICKKAGAVAFEGDCVHFYRCGGTGKSTKAELYKCPDKYVFDPKIEFCRRKKKDFVCDKKPSEELMASLPPNFMSSAIVAGPDFLWD